ncbi:hypothetical protein [Aquisalinus flavus]|uniref:Uncharacterized protein n=1 Tax=Aquisalinus flavus TaxID=1526572 RepID=A0A8J2V7P6_9PROT|nr:hypothetical protein [Aquisalinus flavus]MBD0425823.1 hypothetical protein [Aquisalinus flavus]UNE48574.1 hypothetical protein FF099_11205 [Aquisalinus flavus]GGD12966.1 hypothetical protein GCM10011342_22190 [Aquisalinus flavus]
MKIAVSGLLAGAGALALFGFYAEMQADAMGPEAATSLAAAIPTPASIRGYEALAQAALARQPLAPADLDLARTASLKTLSLDPGNVSAWNRLAYIDLADDGRLSRDGMAAIYKSYEVSPYGNPQVMMWRVDFATRSWTSLPDDIRRATLDQLPVIGGIYVTWDWRVETCRENPYPEIWQPICAATPGIDRPAAR